MGFTPMPATSPLDQPRYLDDLLLYRLSRIVSTAGSMVVRLCEGRFGVTRREWRMVVALAEAGTLQPSELADRVQLDRARTSRAVTSLVGKSLVSRRVVSTDHRQAKLELTAAGHALYTAMFPLVVAINKALVHELSQAEQLAFDHSLLLIQRSADQQLQSSVLPHANRRLGHNRRLTAGTTGGN